MDLRGDNTGIRTDTEFMHRVQDELDDLGVTSYVEYHGVLAIHASRGVAAWTGMHDWDYASWVRHGEPIGHDGTLEEYDPRFATDGSERNLCPRAVAKRWHAAICKVDADMLAGEFIA